MWFNTYWESKFTQLLYHYEFRGKFSKVYRCVNEHDGKDYAMKIINKKKLNRMFNFSKKKAYSFMETEMAILKKIVFTSNA